MTIKSIWLRKVHKWVGLVIGLQFLLWAVSGAGMALLDMEEVAGGHLAEHVHPELPKNSRAWDAVQTTLGTQQVTTIVLRSLPNQQAIQISTKQGIQLFDAADGSPISIGRGTAAAIASAAHPDALKPSRLRQLGELTLPVREHELPIWQADFADDKRSSYYVSGATGAVLERRNDSWRWWDVFWMLHTMDYAKRTSFNHPLIIMVGFAMAWLAVTGFWLLFRTMWRHDFAPLRRLTEKKART